MHKMPTVKCMKWVSVRLNWHRLFCDAGKGTIMSYIYINEQGSEGKLTDGGHCVVTKP